MILYYRNIVSHWLKQLERIKINKKKLKEKAIEA